MGSSEQILADLEAYWVAHDAAETEEERGELFRSFLRAHGGHVVTRENRQPGQVIGGLVGGLLPVRVP